jgi:hypothetical protein
MGSLPIYPTLGILPIDCGAASGQSAPADSPLFQKRIEELRVRSRTSRV